MAYYELTRLNKKIAPLIAPLKIKSIKKALNDMLKAYFKK
jgi:hypothetical protein